MNRRTLERIIRASITDGRPTKLDIVYSKKTTGNVVVRRVRPYEIKSGQFWATDTIHGATRIHKFLMPRILSAEPSDPPSHYRPVWPVKTPGVDPEQTEPRDLPTFKKTGGLLS